MKPPEADPDRNPELTLDLARSSTEPHAMDRSRNWAALRGRLALPAASTGTPPPGGSGTGAAANCAARAASGGLTPWLKLIAVGAVTGSIGVALGLRFYVGEPPSPPPPPLPAYAQPSAAAPAAPLSDVPAASPRSSPQAREPVAELTAPPAAAAPPRATAPASAAAPDFARAVQLLGRARRALARGEPALALRSLDELDAHFPRQLLDEERGATRVLGLCASGEREAAVQLAQRLFAGRPRSIYSRRLEHSCAGEALGARAER